MEDQSSLGVESLELVLDVFRANFRDLNLLLHRFSDPEHVFQVRELGRFSDEDVSFSTQLTQHLHNYLSSLTTLIDHSRNVMRDADTDPDVRGAYENRVRRHFEESPSAGFLKDLRNFMLHYKLPATIARWDETDRDAKGISNSDVMLHLGPMKDWAKWSKRAIAFIDSEGPVVRLLPLVSRYADDVFRLYDWLLPELRGDTRASE